MLRYGDFFMTMTMISVILLTANPASFAHNFVSGVQSFYFSETSH